MKRKSQSSKKRFGFWMFPRTEARGDAPSLWKTADQDVIRALGSFVNQLPKDKRPKLLPIAATNRLFATGNDAVLEELAGLVVEYDGGDVQRPQNDGAPAIEVVALDAVRASDILPQIRGVLSVRQQQVLRMI